MWDTTTIIVLSVLIISVALYFFVFKSETKKVEISNDTSDKNSIYPANKLGANKNDVSSTNLQRVEQLIKASIVDGEIGSKKQIEINTLANELGVSKADIEVKINTALESWKKKREQKPTQQMTDEFTQFVSAKIKNNALMTLLDWQGYKTSSLPNEESGKHPDIFVQWKRDTLDYKFGVECVYHTSMHNDTFVFNASKQEEYSLFSNANKLPIFIAIGLAGKASAPQTVYFVPLQVFEKGSTHVSLLAPYRMSEVSGELTYDYKNMRLRQAPKPVPKQPGV